MPTDAEKRKTFRELHASGCFVLPNPWDVGSAKYLQHLGFRALATTSAGFAFSCGLPDYAVPLDAMLAHIADIVGATNLPVNADFEDGYSDSATGVTRNVKRCLDTGVAGLSIEDSTRQATDPLYDIDTATGRIAAAREAFDSFGGEAILVARTECFLVGREDIDEATKRLVRYAEAGADCLYAPGIETHEEIAAVVAAVAPKPVNLLVGSPHRFSLGDAERLGVRRVSVGGALSRAAWGGFMRAAQELAERGTFDAFAGAAPHGELNQFFARAS